MDDGTRDGELLDALVQTSYAVIATIGAVAARHDLSVTLLRVIAILRDRTPTMSELADHLDLDRSSVTGLINRAVERGLVRRTENELDRRSSRVALTPAGARLAAAGTTEVDLALRPHIDLLSAGQREQLASLLGALGTVAVPDVHQE